MVSDIDDNVNTAPQLPCSPRSFAKAHLDRLRSKSEALKSEVHELSEEFDNRAEEPEPLTALRVQSDILSAEVQNLEQIFESATGDDCCRQEIWDAVQRALRKRYLAELVSLRTAAAFSERGCELPKLERRARKKHSSSNGSHRSSDNASSTGDNASSTEMPLTSTDSEYASPTESIGNCSESIGGGGYQSDDSVSMENSYVLGTVAPPKPMAVPSPKWAPPASAPAPVSHQQCTKAPVDQLDQSCLEVPSPVCPDLRTPAKWKSVKELPLEIRRTSHQEGELVEQDVKDASCLSMSIEDWFDPDLRQFQSQASPVKVPKKKMSQYGDDIEITAMEEDVQMALEVLGFRRSKGDEEEPESVLSVFWPLW